MPGKMDCHGLTDRGLKREVNEDHFLIADLCKSMLIHQTSLAHEHRTRLFGSSQGILLVVADGMGGHAAGERASTVAIESLAHYVLDTLPWLLRLRQNQESDLIEELKEAMEQCQKRIEGEAAARPDRRGMGTTLTMAYVTWPRLYVVHVGDSRCYLLRDERLEQISRDHTEAQKLVERGILEPEEAEKSRLSHLLWNCLGGGTSALSPEVFKVTLRLGDTLLLCTDGLTNCVPEERIRGILGQDRSAEETCQKLVNQANEMGGPDNITVVVARFRELAQLQVDAAAAAAEPAPLQEALA